MQPFSHFIDSRVLVGQSQAFMKEINKIPAIAKCNSCVLISGETGTGKEICARLIHQMSPRSNKPFVPVNCGAIPVELAENELFGHKCGAFTGASATKPGLILEAEKGSLFLDEIDSLPHAAQVKLLRFLQEKTYRPLGSTKERLANVRVLAASSIDVEEAVQLGRLRKDLYYRLNVISLKLPPLRGRRDDIPLLARHFLRKCAAETGKHVTDFSPEVMQMFLLYDWPGNVRELEHVVERAVVHTETSIIRDMEINLPRFEAFENDAQSFKEAKARFVDEFEKAYIQKLLLANHGNISRAAEAARKHRRAFLQLIRKHGIDVQEYKTALGMSHMR